MVYVNPKPNQRKSMLRKQTNFIETEEHVFVRVFEAKYILYKKNFG